MKEKGVLERDRRSFRAHLLLGVFLQIAVDFIERLRGLHDDLRAPVGRLDVEALGGLRVALGFDPVVPVGPSSKIRTTKRRRGR